MQWDELFEYRDGDLFRKSRADKSSSWNKQWAGRKAGTINKAGYVQVQVGPKIYYAHRIIYEMLTGVPLGGAHIDHINGNPSDNRIDNLRPASTSDNLANRGAQKNNTSGYKGVTLHKASGLYHAQAEKAGRIYSFGYFKEPERAHAAYVIGAQKLWGDFANGGHTALRALGKDK